MGGYREYITEDVHKLLCSVHRQLNGELRSLVADATSDGDPPMARVCADLASRLATAVLAREQGEPAPAVSMSEVMPLLRSKFASVVLAGAFFARLVVIYVDVSEGSRLVEAFSTLPVRGRQILFPRFARDIDEGLSTELFRLGLNDRSKSVRQWAIDGAMYCSFPGVIGELRQQLVTENAPSTRRAIEWSISMGSKGHWIDESKYGLRDVWILTTGGVTVRTIPDRALVEYGDDEVVRRLRSVETGITSPTFQADTQWVAEREAEWGATRDCAAFMQAHAPDSTADLSDGIKRSALIAKLKSTPSQLIQMDDFLDGNEDTGSIGCNLRPHPGLSVFRKVLGELSKREGVSEIYFEVSEVTEAPDWPFSERVLICTSVPVKTVEKWLKRLKPDMVSEADGPVPFAAPAGRQWFAAWWD